MHPNTRINIKQEMDVIRLNRYLHQHIAVLGLFCQHKIAHPFGNRAGQDVAAKLGAEDNVVLAAIANAVIRMIGFIRLTEFPILPMLYARLQYNIEQVFPSSLKPLKRVKGLYRRAKAPGGYALSF